ncbi:MAG: hypothetical protein H0T84_10125, partial [Tatlockia sp.]|nr:hypothetical protein [Tatlockia sp.]
KKYFANTDNFSIMSKDEKRTLSLLSDWKKFRQLSFFAKENAIPQDILNVITHQLIDLPESKSKHF